jgi:hypothetical protein
VHDSYPAVLGTSSNIAPVDLLNITNQVRQEHGLSPLQLDSELSQAASGKASDMFANNYWAHISPSGTTPWVFFKNSGYEYLYAGENLARGFSSASEVVNAWMASPSHRDNMLSANYNDVGFAIATGSLTGSDTVLVVEMFGSRYGTKPIVKTAGINNITPIIPQPTSALAFVITTTPPSITPTTGPINAAQNTVNQNTQKVVQVAALEQQPLIDKNNFTRNLVIVVLALFIIVLVIDAIVIEKKKIIRVVSHNLDHIIYLIIILLTIIIIGRGLVL